MALSMIDCQLETQRISASAKAYIPMQWELVPFHDTLK